MKMLRNSLLLFGALLAPAALTAQASLIQPDSLASMLGRSDVAIIDVRQSWTSYLQNHLPGATWLNIEALRAQQEELPFQLLTPGAYAELFRRHGVDPNLPVVIYSAGDQFNIDATFTAWLLSSAGAKQVLLLDGGYVRWELERRPLTQKYPRRAVPVNRFQPGRFAAETASLAEVEKASKGNGVMLVDARPAEQYSGSAGAQLRRGHIPGAISHPWKSDLEQRDLVLVWKSRDSLAAAYKGQGIAPDRNIIIYCNSGTEASHVFFALKYILGYPRVRVYTGAWSQWAEREELPIE